MKLKTKRKKLSVKKVNKPMPQRIEVEKPEVEVPAEVIDTKTTALDKVLETALDISNRCSDHVVKVANSSTVELQDDLSLIYRDISGDRRKCGLSRYALSQFGSKIGVPANYLEKCVNKGRPDIAQYNVNAWLADYNKPLLMREYQTEDGEDTIRGVLSDKYAICDTPEIIEGIDKTLDLGTFNLKGSFVSPERFHLRLAEKSKMPVDGEDLFAGMSIDSSDVGKSTLSVNFLVFKQVCTNGLIVNRSSTQLFKQKHIGITADAFRLGLSEGIELFPKITEKIVRSIERTRNSDSPFDFNYEDDEQLADLVLGIRKQTDLSPIHAQNVVDIMTSGRYEQNRWGYINALTEVAQSLTLEKRLLLEENAGRLLVA